MSRTIFPPEIDSDIYKIVLASPHLLYPYDIAQYLIQAHPDRYLPYTYQTLGERTYPNENFVKTIRRRLNDPLYERTKFGTYGMKKT